LSIRKQAPQKFDVERFNFTKLIEQGVRKQYQIEVSEMFATFENLNDREDINRAWGNIKKNVKIDTRSV
jgi:hypothetical protein